MFKLGLTGGIGSGKTAASDWFAQQGIVIVDADVVAREVVGKGEPALVEIVDAFGADVLQADGTLDRRILRQRVFEHEESRKLLERITHPRIFARIVQQLESAQSPYAILVSPLLLEGQQRTLVDRVLLIDAPVDMQLQRASVRDGQPLEHIQAIVNVQMPREQKQQLADDVVVNDGSLDDLHTQLARLHTRYLALTQA